MHNSDDDDYDSNGGDEKNTVDNSCGDLKW